LISSVTLKHYVRPIVAGGKTANSTRARSLFALGYFTHARRRESTAENLYVDLMPQKMTRFCKKKQRLNSSYACLFTGIFRPAQILFILIGDKQQIIN
jgi:hypothetical protein